MRKHAHIGAWLAVWAAILFVAITCVTVASGAVPNGREVTVTPDEVLINLFVDRNGNITSGLRIEAVIFDVNHPPDGLSPRCAATVRDAVDGTRSAVCYTTDDLARFLYGDPDAAP